MSPMQTHRATANCWSVVSQPRSNARGNPLSLDQTHSQKILRSQRRALSLGARSCTDHLQTPAPACLRCGYGGGGGEVGGWVCGRVAYPRVPPARSIGPGRRQEMAREWLVSLSQAPSQERIEALAPLVGRFSPHSSLGRIASQFVAANRLPVHEDVITAYLPRSPRTRRRGC